MSNTPTIGRIVHYVLSEQDCSTVEARRAHMQAIREGENQGNPCRLATSCLPSLSGLVAGSGLDKRPGHLGRL